MKRFVVVRGVKLVSDSPCCNANHETWEEPEGANAMTRKINSISDCHRMSPFYS